MAPEEGAQCDARSWSHLDSVMTKADSLRLDEHKRTFTNRPPLLLRWANCADVDERHGQAGTRAAEPWTPFPFIGNTWCLVLHVSTTLRLRVTQFTGAADLPSAGSS